MHVKQRREQHRVGRLREKVTDLKMFCHAYLACMVLCRSFDTQRSELLLITVSVMLHYHSLQVERKKDGDEFS